MDELTPIYRVEFFLDAIVNDSENPYSPIHRIEYYLAKIAGEDVEIPTPIYRIEYYLAKIAGEDVEIPSPIYRAEFYLAAICGEDVDVPEPLFRIEYWLAEWVEQSGGIEKTVTGNPIHITDALAKPVQALSVKLEPVQDLHGYDNPWPSGGGVNKLNPNTVTAGYIGSDGVLYPASETMREYYTDFIPISPSTTYTVGYFGYASGEAPWKAFGWYDANKIFISRDASASTDECWQRTSPSNAAYARASFRTYNHGVEKGLFALGTVSTYSPYSNLCPIYGHTDADVYRTGKNMIDMYGNSGSNIISKNVYLKAGTYTLSATGINGNYATYVRKATTEGSISGDVIANKVSGGNLTFTLSADTAIVVQWYCPNDSSTDLTGKTFQLELGSTASDYQPYVGTTYPIPLGTTVYGGTLDVLTGVLTVTHKCVTLNGSENNWSLNADFAQRFTINDPILVGDTQVTTDTISNYLVSTTWGIVSFTYGLRSSGTLYVCLDQSATQLTLNEFKAYLAENNLQICFKLATPQTIQLTPQQVELLQGENNLFSDGEMTLVYLADGNASDVEALNILLGGRYVNNHGEDEPTDREALDIVLGGKK